MTYDPLTPRDVEMLVAVRKTEVPASPEKLRAASSRVQAVTIYRAAVADRLYERVRENARLALRLYMEALSLKYTQARWAEGVEYALWRAATVDRRKLTVDEARQLTTLAVEADGWFATTSTSDEPEFVARDVWLIQYGEWADETG